MIDYADEMVPKWFSSRYIQGGTTTLRSAQSDCNPWELDEQWRRQIARECVAVK